MAAMEAFSCGDVVSTSTELVRSALEISIFEQQSVWDSMILAAALQRRCAVLFSEDLGNRRRFRSLEIRNPFI
jgi:predicted nucleic acid-binding protein